MMRVVMFVEREHEPVVDSARGPRSDNYFRLLFLKKLTAATEICAACTTDLF
ncbi:MAG: hypothetical protein ACJ749_16965 [Flavisolibacter sp.]